MIKLGDAAKIAMENVRLEMIERGASELEVREFIKHIGAMNAPANDRGTEPEMVERISKRRNGGPAYR